MSETNDKDRRAAEVAVATAPHRAQQAVDDAVASCAPGFALGSLMISASQTQSRAMEAATMALANSYAIGMSTTSQCVTRVLGMPTESLQEFIATLQSKLFT